MKSTYKRLGNYIREIKVRNSEQKVEKLLGINIDKFFMPSVANVIGTDLSVYKVVSKNQFACNRMHVGRDYRLPISMSKFEEEFIVSPAYDVFEIIDKSQLDPEFLMLWFSRREFDRNAWFYTDADVRGGLPWKSFCDMQLPIPSITKQREIVKEYNTIQKRIELNQQLIQKLEETAQAIYKQWFMEFEFPDETGKPYKSNGGEMVWNEELGKEIPKGWEISDLDTEYDITIGRTPPRVEEEWFNSSDDSFDWISIKDLASCDTFIFSTNEKLTSKAVKKFSIPKIPVNTTILSFKMSVGKLAITTKEMLSNEAIAHFKIKQNSRLTSEFIYCFLDCYKFNALGTTSSIVDSINTKMIKEIDILIPEKNIIELFQKIISNTFSLKKAKELENQKLIELNKLQLSRIATTEK